MPNTYETKGGKKFLDATGLSYLWRKIRERFDSKLDNVIATDDSIVITNDNEIAVQISPASGNVIQVINSEGEKGLFVQAPATQDTYTITKMSEASSGASTSYKIQKFVGGTGDAQDIDGAAVIDIPKDMVVQSGSVETKTKAGAWGPAGTYLHLVLANSASDDIYINVSNLIEYVTSGSVATDMVRIEIDSRHRVTAVVTDGSITKEKLSQDVQDSLDRPGGGTSICGDGEYDPVTGEPTIASPMDGVLYLVPDADTENLYAEWIYVDDEWNRVGTTAVDQSDIVLVQPEQPTEDINKLWIDSDSGEETTVPTIEEFNQLLEEVNEIKSDFYYKAVSISSFTSSVTQAEMGSVVDSVTLTYSINKTPDALTLDGAQITPAKSGSEQLTGLGLTSNKTWTLVASDNGSSSYDPATSRKTATITFLNRVFYGASAAGTVDSAFVSGLSSKILTGSRSRTITVAAGSGEYIWYCVPVRLGTCSFKVRGFDGGFEDAETVSVTNSSGYTENYYVYRSSNSGLGEISIVVS